MKTIKLVHLYAKEMNIYGDNGNVLVLQQRLAWRGIKSLVVQVGVDQPIPKDTHLVIGGGGQDAGQSLVADDLQTKRKQIHTLAEDGVPMLMICGMYQLFGKEFITASGERIEGIGLFDSTTVAQDNRLIGNVVSSTRFGKLTGYENHSGRTKLGSESQSFGTVLKGQGNDGEDLREGAKTNNVFGSYLHGPVLAKSPKFADHLLRLALDIAGEFNELAPIDDSLEGRAAEVAANRPR